MLDLVSPSTSISLGLLPRSTTKRNDEARPPSLLAQPSPLHDQQTAACSHYWCHPTRASNFAQTTSSTVQARYNCLSSPCVGELSVVVYRSGGAMMQARQRAARPAVHPCLYETLPSLDCSCTSSERRTSRSDPSVDALIIPTKP